MRRSEMILKLMEILVEAPSDVEAAANDILNRLERAGMLPPNSGPGGYDEGPVDAIIEFHCKWEDEKPELIKVDLGHNASRHYKETLFEDADEVPVEGFSQLVTCADRCGGRVTVKGRRVEPRHVENFTDEEVKETWDLSDEQIADCRRFLDSRRSGAV